MLNIGEILNSTTIIGISSLKNKETLIVNELVEYFMKIKERVMGIEPTYLAWKASVLPLNYTRIFS